MLSLFVEMMETEQRTLYVVSVCGNDGNRTENIACCAEPLNFLNFQICFVNLFLIRKTDCTVTVMSSLF